MYSIQHVIISKNSITLLFISLCLDASDYKCIVILGIKERKGLF